MSKLCIPIIQQNKQIKGLFYSKATTQEISIALFGECNLRCTFCVDNRRHMSKCNPEHFKHTTKLVEKILATTEKKHIEFRIYGGELFQDKFDDSIFEAYDVFLCTITKLCRDYDKTYKLQFASNLMHKNTERVLKLLNKHNCTLYGSYDIVGRYTKQYQIDLFVNNALYYQKQLPNRFYVSFVASPDNINSILTRSNLYTFDTLYRHCSICFDYCNDNGVGTKEVDEDKLSDFVVYMIDHYPNIINIQDFKTCLKAPSKALMMSCPIAFIIENRLIFNCCNHKQVSTQYVENKHCFQCKYYSICPHYCPRLMSKYHGCHIKKAFEYIESKLD